MTIYTCVRRKNENFYTCKKGFFDTSEIELNDYKILSIPSSTLTFDVLRNILELEYLKCFFPKIYHKTLRIID